MCTHSCRLSLTLWSSFKGRKPYIIAFDCDITSSARRQLERPWIWAPRDGASAMDLESLLSFVHVTGKYISSLCHRLGQVKLLMMSATKGSFFTSHVSLQQGWSQFKITKHALSESYWYSLVSCLSLVLRTFLAMGVTIFFCHITPLLLYGL
jgi:hypothetical protein